MKRLSILLAFLLTAASANAQRYRGFNDYERPRFRFGVHGGWSYRTAKVGDGVPPDFKQYVKKLKSGYGYGADAAFFFNNSIWGIGVEYSGFHAKNEMSNVWVQDTATKKTTVGIMADNISIQFIGPSVLNRYIIGSNGGFQLIATMAVGYLSYTNNAVLIDKYKITGATVGVVGALSFDFAVTENFFLGLDVEGVSGTLDQVTISDGTTTETIKLPEGQYESLSRLNVFIGGRYNF